MGGSRNASPRATSHADNTTRSTLVFVALGAILTRHVISLGEYSGHATPPMYGDYEAQRHWLEITTSLPVADWYRETPQNNLSYWGLDYPPLTAFHSYALGKVARLVEPDLVALNTSRGYETPSSKAFMRATALASDVVVYFTGVLAFYHRNPMSEFQGEAIIPGVIIALFQPALMLIDHGHFQYNAVSLGLALWAIVALLHDWDLAGAALFCHSLGFKQMSLFFAPTFFFYLLGKSFKSRRPVLRVAIIGAVVIAQFALLLGPWLPGGLDAVVQIFRRVFPVERGLFEDKVANLWCATTLVIKWRQLFSRSSLALISLGVTLLTILPTGVHLLRRPTKRNLVVSMCCTAFGFFLCSFQVHEKSILLPLLPLSIMFPIYPELTACVSTVATFSLYPLLKKDGLMLQYIAVQLMFILIAEHCCDLLRGVRQDTTDDLAQEENVVLGVNLSPRLCRRAFLFGTLAVHVAAEALPVSERYPHIGVYLNVLFSAGVFVLTMLYLNYQQIFGRYDRRSKKSKTQ